MKWGREPAWNKIEAHETRAGTPIGFRRRPNRWLLGAFVLCTMLLIVCIILDGLGLNLALALPLAVGAWSAIAAAETDADSPLNQTLFDKIRGNLDFLEDAVSNGDRIKLLPSVFVSGSASAAFIVLADDGSQITRTQAHPTVVTATINIPTGYKATKVIVYGDDETDDVEVFECELDNNTAKTSKGTGQIEADDGSTTNEIDITDVPATALNYLAIQVASDGNANILIYGGWVTIARA